MEVMVGLDPTMTRPLDAQSRLMAEGMEAGYSVMETLLETLKAGKA